MVLMYLSASHDHLFRNSLEDLLILVAKLSLRDTWPNNSIRMYPTSEWVALLTLCLASGLQVGIGAYPNSPFLEERRQWIYPEFAFKS